MVKREIVKQGTNQEMEADGMTRVVRPELVHRIARTPSDVIRAAMRELPYGMYVVGSRLEDGPNAMIADWVMQVSFTPRLVAVALERDATTLRCIREHGAFTVNLLQEQDNGMALAARFLQPHDASKIRGRSELAAARTYDKLAGVEYTLGRCGCPILCDALAWLDCEARDFVAVGDHVLVTGEVCDGDVTGRGTPLTSTYTGWSYSG